MLSTIQVDLDSLWTYQRYLNKQMPEQSPDPVYSQSLEQFLDLLAKYNLKATFFIIGKDAQNPLQVKYIKTIISQGHEVANHSMNHLPDFANLTPEELSHEIVSSHNLLKSLINKDPVGFRAPVFSINEQVINLLELLGYAYDASLMPSAVFPLLMRIAHSVLKLRPVNINSGNFRFGKAPRSIYSPDNQDIVKLGKMRIKQVPVSVSAFLRLPMHSTYVFAFGKFLFDSGFNFCLKKGLTLHYLFHGIDLLDIEQYSIKLPGFKSLAARKGICEYIVKKMAEHSQVMTTEDLVKIGKESNGLHLAPGF